MSTRSSRTGASDAQHRDWPTPLPSLSRYDLVLALIPAVFLLATGLAGLFDVPLRVGLAFGSVVGTGIVADALFLNPPTRSRRGR